MGSESGEWMGVACTITRREMGKARKVKKCILNSDNEAGRRKMARKIYDLLSSGYRGAFYTREDEYRFE